VDLQIGTNVSEEDTASIFILEDGGSMILQDVDTYLFCEIVFKPLCCEMHEVSFPLGISFSVG
jgi:hypothetical protein